MIQFTKWFAIPLRSSNLNQKIHEPAPDLNQRICDLRCESRSESKDSLTIDSDRDFRARNANDSIHKMIRDPAPKFQSESKDSRTSSRSESNYLQYTIRLERFETVNHFVMRWFNVWNTSALICSYSAHVLNVLPWKRTVI